MTKKIKVLITGSGGAASQSIMKSLNFAGGHSIISTDIDPFLPGVYRGDKGYLVPKGWNSYISTIRDICIKEKVDILIPGSDIELGPLSENKETIENIGTKMIISTQKAIDIGNDKWQTYLFLKDCGFPTIPTYLEEDLIKKDYRIEFPVIVKPRFGWSSLHVYLVKDINQLKTYISLIKKDGFQPVIQEHIGSLDEEYTSGVYISKEKEILGAISLWRILRKGNSLKTRLADDEGLVEEMQKIATKLNTTGPVNLQCRRWDGKYYVFEINTRFSGTTIIQAYMGLNGPDALVRNFVTGEKPKIEQYKKLIGMMYLNYTFVREQDYEKLLRDKSIEKTGYVDNWL